MIITELNDQVEGEMDALVRQGMTSFKLFMAYPGVFMLDDASIFKALLRTGKNGGTICMHAENGGVIDVLVQRALAEGKTAPKYHALTRPARAEAEATHRAIALAEIADVPIYIVHLSAAEALEMVTEARDRGLPAYAETCPQYLFLSYDNYEEPGFDGAKYVMSPPLRDKAKQDQLWRGLAFNDLQAISTDHCPFCMKEQKELGENDFSKIPNGAPGIETRMSLVYDGGVAPGRISLNRFVELTSTSPAKIFGLFPRKGTIAPGSDADIVVFDPNRTITLSAKTLHMNVDYNPYEGRQVTGATDTVLSRGRLVIEDGKFVGARAPGRFSSARRALEETGLDVCPFPQLDATRRSSISSISPPSASAPPWWRRTTSSSRRRNISSGRTRRSGARGSTPSAASGWTAGRRAGAASRATTGASSASAWPASCAASTSRRRISRGNFQRRCAIDVSTRSTATCHPSRGPRSCRARR